MTILFESILTFLACIAISINFNIKGFHILFSAIGGMITFLVFSLSSGISNVAMQCFLASMFASIYSETLARIVKVPATTFLIVSIIPLVPGSDLYRTMELCINQEIMKFVSSALNTLGIAGSIALGILLVSSLYRFTFGIVFTVKKKKHNKNKS